MTAKDKAGLRVRGQQKLAQPPKLALNVDSFFVESVFIKASSFDFSMAQLPPANTRRDAITNCAKLTRESPVADFLRG